jgi:glycosyltransferase involved in cell wall biosynthesis
VSIVLATYNRSGILAHAIESVRRSTLEDWELIVVGDCCTDDTAAVVASFGDARITFVNLENNVGEQSGPNNEGVRRARGRYLAFLNHDDLYFPDHLAVALDCLARTGADLVWSPIISVRPMSAEDLDSGRWLMRIDAVMPGEAYDPRTFVFASAWVMTRELASRVGPWRHASESFVTPSQEWLFRAWKSGARLRQLPHPTVLAIPAGPRKGSYVRASPEHEFFAARMRDDARFRERALALAAIRGEQVARQYRLGRALRSLVVRPISATATRLGFHPLAPLLALRYGRRGALVNTIRRRTGLGKMSNQP